MVYCHVWGPLLSLGFHLHIALAARRVDMLFHLSNMWHTSFSRTSSIYHTCYTTCCIHVSHNSTDEILLGQDFRCKATRDIGLGPDSCWNFSFITCKLLPIRVFLRNFIRVLRSLHGMVYPPVTCVESTPFFGISSTYRAPYITCCSTCQVCGSTSFFRTSSIYHTRYMTCCIHVSHVRGPPFSSGFHPCTALAARHVVSTCHMCGVHLFLQDFIYVPHSLHDMLYPPIRFLGPLLPLEFLYRVLHLLQDMLYHFTFHLGAQRMG